MMMRMFCSAMVAVISIKRGEIQILIRESWEVGVGSFEGGGDLVL